ncbi:MAG: JAB domain-containing protein [Oscillospiraceae bacterium]|nr:JAB domain-containing protein [Oscillospiraceae bacterium]
MEYQIALRLLNTTMDELSQADLLTFLLCYCEKNPEETAHKLLEQTRNLANLLDADTEILRSCDSLSTAGLSLIRLVSELHRRYLLIRSRTERYLRDANSIAQYLLPLFTGEREEVVYLLCMDRARMVLGCSKLSRGDSDSAALPLRAVVREALVKDAGFVVLAHNHPTGSKTPSKIDIDTTLTLRAMLAPLGIELLDHIIYANDSFLSMEECHYYHS